jgi:hypothetical protein
METFSIILSHVKFPYLFKQTKCVYVTKKKYWMAFGVFFFGVFTYLSIAQSLFMGSEYFMLYEDLDKVGRHNDIL